MIGTEISSEGSGCEAEVQVSGEKYRLCACMCTCADLRTYLCVLVFVWHSKEHDTG